MADWFAPKRYGIGCGFPIAWQGWLLSGLFVAQFVWSSWLSTAVLGLVGTVGLALWVLLLVASVPLFRRETILTRWR